MRKEDTLWLTFSIGLMLIGLLSLTVFAAGCSKQTRVQLPSNIGFSDDIVDQHARAVSIVVRCASGTYFGSGVIISENRILTAQHVVVPIDRGRLLCPGGVKITVIMQSARKVEVTVRHDMAKHDLAVLESVEPMKVPPVVIGSTNVGDEICIVPVVPVRSRVCGQVAGTAHHLDMLSLQHGAITIPGNSGSGIYDLQGHLVAIGTHGYSVLGRVIGGAGTILQPLAEDITK